LLAPPTLHKSRLSTAGEIVKNQVGEASALRFHILSLVIPRSWLQPSEESALLQLRFQARTVHSDRPLLPGGIPIARLQQGDLAFRRWV